MSRPHKNARHVVVAVVVFVVLCGVFAFLRLMPPPAPPGDETPPPSDNVLETLADISPDTLRTFRCVRADGRGYAVTLSQGQEGVSYIVNPAFAPFAYRESELAALSELFAGLSARLVVDSPDAARLAEYGLDEPQAVWTATGAKTVTLSLGNPTPMADGYYAQVTGKTGVYQIPIAAGQALARTEADLRDLRLLPTISQDNVTETVGAIRVVGKKTYALRVLSPEEAGQSDVRFSAYELTEPIIFGTNDYYVNKQVIAPLAAIAPSKVVEDHPKDLAPYGLDQPSKLELTGPQGDKTVLLIGRKDKEAGGRYIMYEGVDSVLLDTAGTYLFLETDYESLMSELLWLHNITSLTQVSLVTPDDVWLLEFHYEDSGEDQTMHPTLRSMSGTFNREISEDNAKRLYQRVLGLTLSKLLAAPPPEGASPAYLCTLEKQDGSSHTMTLYPYNERLYAASLDGEPAVFGIGVPDIDKLEEAIATVQRGEEIPYQ